MSSESRRNFLTSSGKLILGAATAGALMPAAARAEHQHSFGGGVVVDATQEDTCATCQYWGGMRITSDDGKQVNTQSLGWCNNPDSPNFHKLTAADHTMQKSGIWKKWAAL